MWDIVAVPYTTLYPDRKVILQKECRDKILNGDISRYVQLIYLESFVWDIVAVPFTTLYPDRKVIPQKECRDKVFNGDISMYVQSFDTVLGHQSRTLYHTVSREEGYSPEGVEG